MGRVILCETTPATISYIFPNTKIEVFSYEELCYYIYNNTALISEEFIGVSMFKWLSHELGLKDLADRLAHLKQKDGTDLTDLLTTILTYKEYYSIDEVKKFIVRVDRLKKLEPVKHRKLEADGFLRYHKYLRALAIYDEILEQNPDMNNPELLSAIYHNRGIALANNFELQDAMDSYMNAYNLSRRPESLYGYLLLMATVKQRDDIEILAKHYHAEDMVETIYESIDNAKRDVAGSPISKKLEKALYHFEKNNLKDFSQRMDKVIDQLKTEFREQMG